MQAQPRISIVTVTRNAREFVIDTIRSVSEQTYPLIEYIVVDGASTDGTLDIIRSHACGISSWISEPDSGIADAFNKGLALSSGDYVLFLNSDDRLASAQAVERMVAAIVESDFPDLIYGDCDLIDRRSGAHLYTASIDVSPRGLMLGRTLPHPSLFTCREYFERFGPFDTQFRIAMDYELLLRGVLRSRVVHVPVLVTEVRTGGISTYSPAVIPEIVRALRKNGLIGTPLGAVTLLVYFRVRAFLRRIRTFLRSTRIAPWLKGDARGTSQRG